MEYRNVFLAFPSRTGSMRLQTAAALLRDCSEFGARGWNYQIRGRIGDGFIQRARNLLVSEFLLTNCTDLFFLDDDVTWEEGALARILLHPVDLVGATYRVKDDSVIRYVMRRLHYDNPNPPIIVRDTETGLLEIDGLPGGFMRISRAGILRMVEQRKDTEIVDANSGLRTWDLFDVVRLKTGYEGEDYTFCRRWREGGGKVWLDPDIRTGHIGDKQFNGCFAEELKALTATSLEEHIRRELEGAENAA